MISVEYSIKYLKSSHQYYIIFSKNKKKYFPIIKLETFILISKSQEQSLSLVQMPDFIKSIKYWFVIGVNPWDSQS